MQGPHDVALVAQRAFVGAHRRVPHAFAQCGIRPQQYAVIAGVLKMQMTEQSPVSEHGAFRHGLHRDEYGEGIGGTGIASVEHMAGFAFQPLVVHMIEPIFMCCDGGCVFRPAKSG